jgi:outer membrane lipoprotein carrier protein
MYKLYSLLFIISIGFTAQAQNSATNILDKTAAKIKASNGINVSFSLTQKDKLNHTLATSKGILKIKGAKYYVQQDGIEIFCNGVNVWNYDGQNEVTVSNASNDEDEFSPQQILSGFNKKDFDIKLLSSTGTYYQLQLIPHDKRKNFKQVILYINKSTNLIAKATITDKTNAATQISFDSISLNATIPDSQFVFDISKHPGVEVVNQ